MKKLDSKGVIIRLSAILTGILIIFIFQKFFSQKELINTNANTDNYFERNEKRLEKIEKTLESLQKDPKTNADAIIFLKEVAQDMKDDIAEDIAKFNE